MWIEWQTVRGGGEGEVGEGEVMLEAREWQYCAFLTFLSTGEQDPMTKTNLPLATPPRPS